MSEYAGTRGPVWFRALTGHAAPLRGDPASVLTADAPLGGEKARFLCVVRDPQGRYPCARDGQVGLEEAYALAARVREAVAEDRDGIKRPIVAIVDVKSQAYGRREEMAAIHLAAACAVDAYDEARVSAHPVIALVVGHALSGGFVSHGLLANRVLALDDAGVMIHAMHPQAAARIMHTSVESLERASRSIAPLSYDIGEYAKLGLLHRLLQVEEPENPSAAAVQGVKEELAAAVREARQGPLDLSDRWLSPQARQSRSAELMVRAALAAQWAEPESGR